MRLLGQKVSADVIFLALEKFKRRCPQFTFPVLWCASTCFPIASPAECFVILSLNVTCYISVFNLNFSNSFNNFSCVWYAFIFWQCFNMYINIFYIFCVNCLFMYFSHFSIRFWFYVFQFLRVFLYVRNTSSWWDICCIPPFVFWLWLWLVFALMTPCLLQDITLINAQFSKLSSARPLLLPVSNVVLTSTPGASSQLISQL